MLITNIGTLVTNDPELGTLTNASIVFDNGKVAWVGHDPPEAAGTRPHRRRGPGADPRLRGQPRPPRLRGRPRAGVRRADGGPPVHRRRHQDHRRRHESREQRGAQAEPRPAHPRGAALRHDDRRDEVRLRPHGLRRAPQPRGGRRPGAHLPRRPRGAAGGRRGRIRRARQGRDARRLRPACDLDRRLLRGRRLRRRADQGDPPGRKSQRPHAASPREPAQARPRHPDRRRARRRLRRPLHPRDRRTTSTRSPTPTRSPRSCPARSSPRERNTPTHAGSSTPASRSPSPPTATPAPPTPRTSRSASRSPSGRCT